MLYDAERKLQKEITHARTQRLTDLLAEHAKTRAGLRRQEELLAGLEEAVNKLFALRGHTESSGGGGALGTFDVS